MKLKKYVFKQITLKNKSQMKTKNVLVAAVILISSVLSVSGVFAQNESSRTATVNLKITLNPIQTITVNPDQNNVDLVYKSKNDYNDGVDKPMDKHLKVFSTGGFEVKVKSGEFLSNGITELNIPASHITVQATASGNTNGGSAGAVVTLGTTEKSLITSEKGGRDLEYNVTYTNKTDADAYINHYLNGGVEKNTFTTTVTYTIAAK